MLPPNTDLHALRTAAREYKSSRWWGRASWGFFAGAAAAGAATATLELPFAALTGLLSGAFAAGMLGGLGIWSNGGRWRYVADALPPSILEALGGLPDAIVSAREGNAEAILLPRAAGHLLAMVRNYAALRTTLKNLGPQGESAELQQLVKDLEPIVRGALLHAPGTAALLATTPRAGGTSNLADRQLKEISRLEASVELLERALAEVSGLGMHPERTDVQRVRVAIEGIAHESEALNEMKELDEFLGRKREA